MQTINPAKVFPFKLFIKLYRVLLNDREEILSFLEQWDINSRVHRMTQVFVITNYIAILKYRTFSARSGLWQKSPILQHCNLTHHHKNPMSYGVPYCLIVHSHKSRVILLTNKDETIDFAALLVRNSIKLQNLTYFTASWSSSVVIGISTTQ